MAASLLQSEKVMRSDVDKCFDFPGAYNPIFPIMHASSEKTFSYTHCSMGSFIFESVENMIGIAGGGQYYDGEYAIAPEKDDGLVQNARNLQKWFEQKWNESVSARRKMGKNIFLQLPGYKACLQSQLSMVAMKPQK